MLAHHTALIKVLSEAGKTLNPSILQLTLLVRMEHLPSASVEFLLELKYHQWVREVDERITDVSLVFEINR